MTRYHVKGAHTGEIASTHPTRRRADAEAERLNALYEPAARYVVAPVPESSPDGPAYWCPHRNRWVDLSVTHHGPIKKRPGPGLGPELTEALRPRDDFKAAYYAGGLRVKLDGAPMRVAGHVAKWSTRSKQKICCYLTPKEWRAIGRSLA
jgi:hypothetical protein